VAVYFLHWNYIIYVFTPIGGAADCIIEEMSTHSCLEFCMYCVISSGIGEHSVSFNSNTHICIYIYVMI